MKAIYRYITFLLLSLPIIGQTQTYIQGKDLLPFSQVGTSKYLTPKTQISLEEASAKRKEIEDLGFKETMPKIQGEYYSVDSMLTSLNSSDLLSLRKLKYKGLYYNYQYMQSSDLEGWHLMYRDLGTHKIMISYSKKSQLLFYDVENDTYSIMGTVYAPKNKIAEAQKFIEKLVESISLKKNNVINRIKTE